jgi:hypothetical protein
MWDLWWTKRHWGRFSLSASVSPANHSINFSIIIITQGWQNRLIGGSSAEWTQLDSSPPTIPIKKYTHNAVRLEDHVYPEYKDLSCVDLMLKHRH